MAYALTLKEGYTYLKQVANNRISVFEADGKFYRHISGNLNGPWGIAFDSSGNLHVSNYNIHSVKVFSPEGSVIKEYGSGIIQSPAGIAIDPKGYVATMIIIEAEAEANTISCVYLIPKGLISKILPKILITQLVSD